MARKRWTPNTLRDAHANTLRQKKKWQIALRRYVIEGQKSTQYAPYFGLDTALFRQWIEIQFDASMSWDNFSSAWQLDHIIPTHYFDMENDQDLRLCWNFINIRPGKIGEEQAASKIDVLTAKTYFTYLQEQTGLMQCSEILEKIKALERAQLLVAYKVEQFLHSHKEQLENMRHFDATDFERLNTGTPYNDLAFEKTFFKKFA